MKRKQTGRFRVVENNRYTGRSGIDQGKVIALRRAGWSIKDIAADMGISEDEVTGAIDRYRKEKDNV